MEPGRLHGFTVDVPFLKIRAKLCSYLSSCSSHFAHYPINQNVERGLDVNVANVVGWRTLHVKSLGREKHCR